MKTVKLSMALSRPRDGPYSAFVIEYVGHMTQHREKGFGSLAMTHSIASVQWTARLATDSIARERDHAEAPEMINAAGKDDMSYIRKGALWGAMAGFVVGLVPLLTSTLLAATAGALIAKASHLRIQASSPVRIHSIREHR